MSEFAWTQGGLLRAPSKTLYIHGLQDPKLQAVEDANDLLTLVWHDEFDAGSLNTTMWEYKWIRDNTRFNQPNNSGQLLDGIFSSDRVVFTKPSQVTLQATYSATGYATGGSPSTALYKCGAIQTKSSTMAYVHGVGQKLVVKFRSDLDYRPGPWTSSPTTDGENNCEHFHKDAHWQLDIIKDYGPPVHHTNAVVNDVDKRRWHIWECEKYSDGHVKLYFDGALITSVAAGYQDSSNQIVRLDHQVGGTYDAGAASGAPNLMTTALAEFDIDYVRVYTM